MPSTAIPWASLSVISTSCGCALPSSAARRRTSSVSSSSRHGGAQTRSTGSRVRWSATANARISSISSPKNSTRSGCSSVGGKTSTMPPRTANSPRFSTRSTREYAAPASRFDHVLELDLLPAGQLDRLEVGEPLDLRLQHRANGRDDDLERPVVRLVAGVLDPPQHRQPPADRVAARAQPLVRKRLPRRVERHRLRVEQVLQLLGEVLGLAHRRGDHEHRAPGVDQPPDHERTQRRGPGQVEVRDPLLGVLHRRRERRFAQDQVGQGGDGHGLLLGTTNGWCGHAQRPPTGYGEGVNYLSRVYVGTGRHGQLHHRWAQTERPSAPRPQLVEQRAKRTRTDETKGRTPTTGG